MSLFCSCIVFSNIIKKREPCELDTEQRANKKYCMGLNVCSFPASPPNKEGTVIENGLEHLFRPLSY